MSIWGQVRQILHSWYGDTAALIGITLALYYGPRKMFETWDWYVNRFHDEPVLDELRAQSLLAPELRPRPVQGLTVGELAKMLGRTHRSIGKTVKRLIRQNKVELYMGSFRLKE